MTFQPQQPRQCLLDLKGLKKGTSGFFGLQTWQSKFLKIESTILITWSGGGANFICSSFLTGNVFNTIYLRVNSTSVSFELEGVLYLIIIVAKHWNILMNIIFAKSSTKFIWAIILLIFITFVTVAINDLLCMKNAGAQIAMDFN